MKPTSPLKASESLTREIVQHSLKEPSKTHNSSAVITRREKLLHKMTSLFLNVNDFIFYFHLMEHSLLSVKRSKQMLFCTIYWHLVRPCLSICCLLCSSCQYFTASRVSSVSYLRTAEGWDGSRSSFTCDGEAVIHRKSWFPITAISQVFFKLTQLSLNRVQSAGDANQGPSSQSAAKNLKQGSQSKVRQTVYVR